MATKQEQDVVDRVKNGDNEKFNQKLDGSETLPLTRNKQKTDDELTDPESGKTRRGRLSFDALMQLPRKRRILYILTASLCAVLLVIIILMIAFWPEVPFYLKADLCVDKECVVASQQLLLWSNTTYKPCRDTYQWACGNFRKEYEEGDYFVIKKGEWDYQTYNEYEELRDLNRFISMLPASSQSYSAESMISGLYKSCREIDALDKSQSDMLLRQAIKSVDGWQALRDGNRLQFWEYRKALVYVQAHHGVFPYFKMSVENRYSDPYDYIITLDAGEVGLPDEYFYNADNNDEVIVAYKMLLRDFAINMGVVTQEAELFADEIFHYEKRIVNNILSVQTPNERHINEIKTIQEIKTIAPSLPIFESLQAILPQIKITDETEILVRDVDVLREMSIVVSTSDKKPLNNFIIWSLARKLLPHLSKEYRILTENFNNAIYGRSARYPRWMVCTKIVREWLPFSVDALRENPDLLRTGDSQLNFIRERPNTFPNKTYGNDEFLKLMFHTLRHQVQTSIEEANWIERSLKDFIIEKLASTRLQIGIPSEILQTKSYIDEYYKGLMLYNLYFAEHLESIWSFRKLRMQDKLKSQNIIDMIILEMYAANEVKLISYSTTLNMVLISKQLTQSNYFDYRFPIPINFARVGADIVEVLVESISTFEKQHKWVSKSLTNSHADTVFKIDPSCLADEVANVDRSDSAMSSYTTTMSAARIAAKALTKFIESVDGTVPVIGASIDPSLTYENLQLTNRRRLPGLRRLNENELFTLAYMQKHCSTPIADKDYARIKPHVEKKLAEMYLFKATWRHIQFLPQSTDCSVKDVTCTNVL